MKSVQQLLLGLIAAIGTSLLVLGAFFMALAEDEVRIAANQNTVTVMPSPSAIGPAQETPAITLTASATLPPVQPTACPTPQGWAPYVIQTGDTLEALAAQVGLTAEEIRSANCLSGITLIPNALLYLPAAEVTLTVSAALPTMLPTLPPTLQPTLPPTLTPIPCGPPRGWVPYIVRRGDTLFRLSLAYGISQDMLRIGNCMTGTSLIAGQTLYVPNVITRTPVITITSVPPSATSMPPSATTAAPTEPSPNPTNTSTPTVTLTTTPTLTVVPSSTFTSMPTFTPTFTSTLTATAVPAVTEIVENTNTAVEQNP